MSSYFFILSCAYIILIYKFLVIYSLFDFIFCVKNKTVVVLSLCNKFVASFYWHSKLIM
nr:MAG TPA: hypothetical protein [Bacteriophage sp.]